MSYLGNPLVTSAFVTDQFSGTGSQTSFTMSVAPANTASVLVSISGVLQDPTTYSVNGLTLNFSAAPPAGTGTISVRYLGIPASGIVNTAYRTVTEFTATASQTSFTVPSYTVGFINVFRNGVRLGSADFTATNGTTIVLATGATSGDLVTTESFYVSSVLGAIPSVAGAVTNPLILDGAVTTSKIADANVTPTKLSQPLTIGTAQASTSGTSIDFTSIPSWVKRITVMFNGVSTSGISSMVVKLGTAGGIVSTGYAAGTAFTYTVANTCQAYADATGFLMATGGSAATTLYGSVVFTNLSGNIWSEAGTLFRGDATQIWTPAGLVTLSGTLTTVRLTTVAGTDTFDAGLINILYE